MRYYGNSANGQIIWSSWDGHDSTFWELCLGQTLKLPPFNGQSLADLEWPAVIGLAVPV